MGIDDEPMPTDQPDDGQPGTPLSGPVLVLLVATVATPTVIALWRSVLPPAAAFALTVAVVPALAGIVFWAVRQVDPG